VQPLPVIGVRAPLPDVPVLDWRQLVPVQLATSYAKSVDFGVSYTFGFIFNNVVTPRFGSSAGKIYYSRRQEIGDSKQGTGDRRDARGSSRIPPV
jgi:hypothetical protein